MTNLTFSLLNPHLLQTSVDLLSPKFHSPHLHHHPPCRFDQRIHHQFHPQIHFQPRLHCLIHLLQTTLEFLSPRFHSPHLHHHPPCRFDQQIHHQFLPQIHFQPRLHCLIHLRFQNRCSLPLSLQGIHYLITVRIQRNAVCTHTFIDLCISIFLYGAKICIWLCVV